MNELNQRWREYRDRVVPKDAPSVQVWETRRAYFAGAAAAVDVANRLVTVSPFQRQRELDALQAEVQQFRLDVAADRA